MVNRIAELQARQEARGRGAGGAFGLLEDRTLQARVAVASVALGVANSLLIVFVLVVFEESRTALVVAGMAVVSLVALGVSTRTGWSAAALGNYGGLFVGTVTAHVLLGGYLWSGGALLWGLHAAVNAALTQDRRRTTYLVMGVFVGAAVLLVPAETALRMSREQPALAVSVFVMVDFFVFTTLVVVVPPILALISQLRAEQQRNRALLLNVLPASVADRLKANGGVIADHYDECTVVFADLVGFTAHSRGLAPAELVHELNEVFSRFDQVVAAHGAEKIKTIGDGYMVACGLPTPDPDHASTACRVALGLRAELPAVNGRLGTDYELRIGINTGSAVAGVIGTSKFAYDVWGDTVNLASRIESAARPGSIALSSAVAQAVGDDFAVEPRGVADLKGQGPTAIHELLEARPTR